MDINNSPPAISVVMPCYNAAEHLATSIGSLQAQTRGDWELRVVDDGSTDSSWELLLRLAHDDDRIVPIRQPNAGAAAARNAGLSGSRAPYMAFLDSDDTWHPEFLEAMTAALEANPQAGIAYCGWQNIGLGDGPDTPFIPPDYENDEKTEALLRGCRWPIHGAMTRTRLIQDCGAFDENLSSCMDYDLWLRLGTEVGLVLVPRVMAYYHHHGGEQITRNRARIALNHWRAQQKYLAAHPDVVLALGRRRVRELTDGELLHRGYISYWKRDIPAAREIFRAVMRRGFGSPKDWLYMLPALLPERIHRTLVETLETK